jgi:hypothetical protein
VFAIVANGSLSTGKIDDAESDTDVLSYQAPA